MPKYVRPSLSRGVFYDPNGSVIEYGNRWQGNSPPDDQYSIDFNPRRFAPLHTLADALIRHLRETYVCTVTDDIRFAADLMHTRDDVIRAIRVTPEEADAAALTFVYTSYPGLILHAGSLRDFPYPTCGCEACDETPELLAEDIEERVFGVVTGGYSETVRLKGQRGVGYALAWSNHRSSGFRPAISNDFPSERIRAAELWLRDVPNGWQPWPLETGEATA